jgi:hypothetical protein
LASSINASTTAGVVTTADTSGVLNIQTAGTTAISIDASQAVSFTNQPTYSGGTANGVAYLNGSKVLTTGSGLQFDGVNLGIGSAPNAWDSTWTAVDFLYGGSIGAGNYGTRSLHIFDNAYASSAGYKFSGTGYASSYYQQSGEHNWRSTAATGVAGGAASFTTVLSLAGVGKTFALQGGSSNTGIGISFPATQSASTDANTLDDYEEGTWTPNLTGDVGGSGQTYLAQTGTYTKVGRLVTVNFYIQLNTKGTITGNAIVSNLPFTVLNTGSLVAGGALAYWLNLAVNHNVIGIYCNTNTTNIYFWGSTGTASTPPLLSTTDIANNTRFWGSATYMTA